METPTISVIIPARNEQQSIAACLNVVIAQQPHEVIVVDGGSEDGTVATVRQLASQCSNVICVEAARGRAAQQNSGAARASGEVLLFLHADCELPAEGLRQVGDAVRRGALAGSFRHRIDSDRWPYRVIEWGDALRQRWLRMPYGDQGIFVRRELFERIGGFPMTPLMEDVLLVRTLRRHARLAVLPGVLLTSGSARWERRGVLRQFLLNQWILLAERCGVPIERPARQYYG